MKLVPRLAAALALGCASEDVTLVTTRETSGENPAAYAEGRVPLPDCASFDYGRCDIAERACVERLGSIARCLHGSDPSLPIPEVSFWSESETEADFLAELRVSPSPALAHLEAALARFGLTEIGALEPEATAARLAREVTAYYDHGRRDIAIVEHETRSDPLAENVIVVHEMIHAFQDREHDLGAFDQRYRRGVDGNLRGASVIEGEARMHERRFFAALAGLDVAELDLARSFANLTQNTERWLWSQADLFTASQLGAPYGHGAEYIYGLWAKGGQDSVRALFDAPPASMQEILAAVWGGEVASELEPFAPPASSAPSGSRLETWTAMGAWGIYLLAGRSATDLSIAERLALAWRGDLLEIFSFDESETAARWRVRFGSVESADELLVLVADEPSFEAARDGVVVTLRAATAPPPVGL
jgi:hypothetical protein